MADCSHAIFEIKMIARILILGLLTISPVFGENHALILLGNAGEETRWQLFNDEAEGWEKLFITNGFSKEKVFRIESPRTKTEGETTRQRVKSHLEGWAQLSGADHVVLVVIGYGVTQDGKFQFQVRGPRLTESDFRGALANCKASSTLFLTGPGCAGLAEAMKAPRRTIVSATAAETEINETRFGAFWIETASENPRLPILELLRKADQKVFDFYKEQKLVRTEHAQLRVGENPPVEAPFKLALDDKILQNWTLSEPSWIFTAGPAKDSIENRSNPVLSKDPSL
jgi:hypothetical protein